MTISADDASSTWRIMRCGHEASSDAVSKYAPACATVRVPSLPIGAAAKWIRHARAAWQLRNRTSSEPRSRHLQVVFALLEQGDIDVALVAKA